MELSGLSWYSCLAARLLQNDPVIPAFPDLHLSPASILKELSMYFPNFSSQTRLLTLPAPHEIPPREMQEYPKHRAFDYEYVPFINMCTLQLMFLLELDLI